jgi:macrolide transport system ATP-binding/permease protein
MRILRRFLQRLGSWVHGENDDERLRTEIEDHIALQTADNIRAGLSPLEARREAVLKFGTVEAMREDYRDQRGLPLMETLLLDTRHALRRLRMAPAFTITTILTLALGIGATTSIFTLAHAVLLKSLPVANPAELYRLGKEARCCFWVAYNQPKEISIVSYDQYKYSATIPKAFGNWRRSRRALRRWACGGPALGRSLRPTRANTFPAITLPCSASTRMRDAC